MSMDRSSSRKQWTIDHQTRPRGKLHFSGRPEEAAAMNFSTFDMFQWMTNDARAAFNMLGHPRRYAAGQAIYTQGDHGTEMFRVTSGSVRLSVTRSDGREVIYLVFKPGDCFGDGTMVDGEPRPHTAEALGDVEVTVLGTPAFETLRKDQQSFENALARLLAREMRIVSLHYANRSLDDIRSRVAGRILSVANSLGTDAEGGIHLSVRLSQGELAGMVGVSRQSVNKVLQEFQKAGLLQIEYGNILVRDPARLERTTSRS